jgi:hypothetical protein
MHKNRTLNELRQVKTYGYTTPRQPSRLISQKTDRSNITAMIDDLNQYELGNVTNQGLIQSLEGLLTELRTPINKKE